MLHFPALMQTPKSEVADCDLLQPALVLGLKATGPSAETRRIDNTALSDSLYHSLRHTKCILKAPTFDVIN